MNNNPIAPQKIIDKLTNSEQSYEVRQCLEELESYDITPYYMELVRKYNEVNNKANTHNSYKNICIDIKELLENNFNKNSLYESTNNEIFYSTNVKLNQYYLLDKLNYKQNVVENVLSYIEKILLKAFPNDEVKTYTIPQKSLWITNVKSTQESSIKYIKEGIDNVLIDIFERLEENLYNWPIDEEIDKYLNLYKMGELNAKLQNDSTRKINNTNIKNKL